MTVNRRQTPAQIAKSLQDLRELWRPPENENASAGDRGAVETTLPANSKPLQVQTQPLRGLSRYRQLVAEWKAENPVHTEDELRAACIDFAKVAGLILRQNLLEGEQP